MTKTVNTFLDSRRWNKTQESILKRRRNQRISSKMLKSRNSQGLSEKHILMFSFVYSSKGLFEIRELSRG